jgi:2-deoxy-D-gluconate 3-dehydrogenase
VNWGPFALTGKNAIVTGGAMGIGYGIVSRFVEGGANVVIADLNGPLAASQVGELEGPGKAVAVQVDASELSAGETLVNECLSNFGSVDILVNNAGIYPQVPMLQMEAEMWDKVIDLNLRGLAFVSKTVGAHMAEQATGGKIINLASIDALHPSMVGLAAYDSSKGGVLMFTRAFALEMAPHGVTVNAIAPGGISTEGTAAPLEGSGMTEEQMQTMMEDFVASKIPLGRMGDPDDIAKVAVFLASGASDYMTGEIVVVDGGTLLT